MKNENNVKILKNLKNKLIKFKKIIDKKSNQNEKKIF